jgi:hypothetical protein
VRWRAGAPNVEPGGVCGGEYSFFEPPTILRVALREEKGVMTSGGPASEREREKRQTQERNSSIASNNTDSRVRASASFAAFFWCFV